MKPLIFNFTANCTTVTCYFTLRSVVEWARYDGKTLAIHRSYGLHAFGVKKSVTFESCYDSSPGTLFIKGSNTNYDTWTGI